MIRRLTVFSLIFIVFSNCAKSTDTTNNDGACSQSFIDDANAVTSALRNYVQIAETIRSNDVLANALAMDLNQKLASVKTTCENFKSRHAGVSCRGVKNKQEAFISSSEFDEVCQWANTAPQKTTEETASEKLGSTPQSISAASVSAPSASDPLLNGIKIKETTADYKIVVLDYKKLLSLADKNEILVERGKVYDPVSSGPYQDYLSSKQKIICDVTTEEPNSQKSEFNPNPYLESNTILSVMDYSETVIDDEPGKQSRFLELSFNETNFKIHCIKEKPETDYTWSELQYTFSKIIEVKKNEPGATISSGSAKKASL